MKRIGEEELLSLHVACHFKCRQTQFLSKPRKPCGEDERGPYTYVRRIPDDPGLLPLGSLRQPGRYLRSPVAYLCWNAKWQRKKFFLVGGRRCEGELNAEKRMLSRHEAYEFQVGVGYKE
ncbi:hypothetical protein CEXT_16071 [Caerostris extrusa]|uniref:Uncharacterized protein n=1 Tax=Caerostris extrusa TaxID=172846 RepID=A0AAV4VBT8_CAEEX|nr:hypothetical protein CEXT_16071 [Caerostris extrusa]